MSAWKGLILTACAIALLAASSGRAGPAALPVPAKSHKCPVCGMFIYKYPGFLARVVFRDGSAHFFDGAKDMFKYLLALKKYDPGKTSGDIASAYVTEYYRLTAIDAVKAYYVVGSDIYGPMGRELIPFEKRSEAAEFLSDHRGKAILRYQDITSSIMGELD